MMTPQQRWWLIGGALALTLGAIYLVQEPAEPEVIVKRSVASINHAKIELTTLASVPNIEVLPDLSQKHLAPEDSSVKPQDLFKGHAWYIPPPPPKPVVVKVEVPIPTAPPLPFFYMGKLEQTAQGTLVFLSANNKVISVLVGKNVNPVWRLDKEEANTLTFTYIPLGLVKVLSKAMRQPASNKPTDENNPDGTSNDA